MSFKFYDYSIETRGRVVFLSHAEDDGADTFTCYDSDEAEKAAQAIVKFLNDRKKLLVPSVPPQEIDPGRPAW